MSKLLMPEYSPRHRVRQQRCIRAAEAARSPRRMNLTEKIVRRFVVGLPSSAQVGHSSGSSSPCIAHASSNLLFSGSRWPVRRREAAPGYDTRQHRCSRVPCHALHSVGTWMSQRAQVMAKFKALKLKEFAQPSQAVFTLGEACSPWGCTVNA